MQMSRKATHTLKRFSETHFSSTWIKTHFSKVYHIFVLSLLPEICSDTYIRNVFLNSEHKENSDIHLLKMTE